MLLSSYNNPQYMGGKHQALLQKADIDKNTDVCTQLTDALTCHTWAKPVKTDVLHLERERLMKQAVQARKQQVDSWVQTIRARNQEVPFELLKEQKSLKLLTLQQRTRQEVLQALPREVLDNRTYRNKRDIDRERAQREKQAKREKVRPAPQQHTLGGQPRTAHALPAGADGEAGAQGEEGVAVDDR